MDLVQKTTDAWKLAELGVIREAEISALIEMPCDIEHVRLAFDHATVHKVRRYVETIIAKERKERQRKKELAAARGEYYYGEHLCFTATRTWRDYLRDCEKLELDLDDPAVLFPRNLELAHERTIAQVKHKINETQRAAFQKVVEAKRHLEWERDGLLIRLPEDADELTAEGSALHHCVGGYVNNVVKGETLILLIRKAEQPQTPFYTLEWRDGWVVQCRTKHNKSYTDDPEVAAFVDAWVRRVTGKRKRKAAEAA